MLPLVHAPGLRGNAPERPRAEKKTEHDATPRVKIYHYRCSDCTKTATTTQHDHTRHVHLHTPPPLPSSLFTSTRPLLCRRRCSPPHDDPCSAVVAVHLRTTVPRPSSLLTSTRPLLSNVHGLKNRRNTMLFGTAEKQTVHGLKNRRPTPGE